MMILLCLCPQELVEALGDSTLGGRKLYIYDLMWKAVFYQTGGDFVLSTWERGRLIRHFCRLEKLQHCLCASLQSQ